MEYTLSSKLMIHHVIINGFGIFVNNETIEQIINKRCSLVDWLSCFHRLANDRHQLVVFGLIFNWLVTCYPYVFGLAFKMDLSVPGRSIS